MNDVHSGNHPEPQQGWTPISPEQVRQQRFRETALGRRGYRPEEVDRFLGRCAMEVELWTAAYAEAQEEIYRLKTYVREQVATGRVGANGAAPGGGRPEKTAAELSIEAVNVLARAQAHADQLVADAQAQARAVQNDARDMAETIVSQARQDIDQAAHDYRARSGPGYSADREQAERLGALGRSILAAMSGAAMQLDGASAQINAIAGAFAAELGKLTGAALQPGAAARGQVRAAQPVTGHTLPG